MPFFNVLLLIGIGSLVLSFFIQGKSAIWGGATIGLIIGIILGVISRDSSDIFRAALIGADIGLLANILAWMGNRLSH